MVKAIEDRLRRKLANIVLEDEAGGGALPPGVELEGSAAKGVGGQASACLEEDGEGTTGVVGLLWLGGLAPGVPVLLDTVIANFWPFRQCLPKVQI